MGLLHFATSLSMRFKRSRRLGQPYEAAAARRESRPLFSLVYRMFVVQGYIDLLLLVVSIRGSRFVSEDRWAVCPYVVTVRIERATRSVSLPGVLSDPPFLGKPASEHLRCGSNKHNSYFLVRDRSLLFWPPTSFPALSNLPQRRLNVT